MGSCETKNNQKAVPTIKKKVNTGYMRCTNFETIERQKDYAICKVINGRKAIGTGFLCLVPFPDKTSQLPSLITCNHVLKGNEKEVKLQFNNRLERTLQLDNTRKMYISDEDEKDITIIEIKKEDDFEINDMLEVDYDIFEETDLNTLFQSIYIIHYPFGQEACFTMNAIESINNKDETIRHKCATEKGTSGAPIINLQNCKVIGVHQGGDKSINRGVLLKESIINFNKKENTKWKKW